MTAAIPLKRKPLKIGDRVLTPLGEGTLMDKDGYYLYVQLDFSQAIAEFYAVELRSIDE